MVLPLLIGEEWIDNTGETLVSRYPADNTVNAEVAYATETQVKQAAEVAHAAFASPNWGRLKPHERAGILYRIADIIIGRHEELAQKQMRDNGKPIGECRALVASAAATTRYYGAVCETMEEDITPSRGDYVSMSIYEPMGVVGVITAWNSPIATELQKVAPALAAGNAVILKPAEETPLIALETAKIALEAGLPPGILNVLPGDARTGSAIVAHPKVKKVSFTGGTEAGRSIARMAAEKLMPVTLELGGKSPNIVFADAELDHALNGSLFAIFSSAGQACIAGSRLFVERSIYDKFVSQLCERARALRVGLPTDPATQMGPLVTFEHREKVERYVEIGLSEGGRVVCGGARLGGEQFEQGAFYLPTIITELSNTSRTAQEEIFGPVLCVIPFEDEEELVRQANDTVYGLACGIWTRDYKRAWRVASKIQAGTIWINTFKQFSPTLPFGGAKDSGIGREKGRQAVRTFMEQKSLFWGLNETPIPWAD